MRRFHAHRPGLLLSVLFLLITQPSPAQVPGGGQGGNQGGGQGGGGQGGQNQQTGGILIDADGVVQPQPDTQFSAKLLKERRDAFAAKAFDANLKVYSDRRSVSLVQLAAECARRVEAGQLLGDDLRALAGLQRIDYVFIDDESRDIVIAGPAEGFAPDPLGRLLGLTTERPALLLENLLVALQAARDGQRSIGCSIDPDPSRLASMGNYIRNNSSATSPTVAAQRYRRMSEILGRQNVSVFGVPDDSHFAHVLVEADFRMKRISLGVEPAGVRGLASHLSLLKPNGNSIQRWWFVPYYDAIYASADHTAFQLVGQRCQLLAQDEIADLAGRRSDAAFTRATTEQFARMFTERFPELADSSAVFAQLQNLFDLAVVSALLQKEAAFERVGAPLATLVDLADSLVGVYAVPRHVESESTFRRANRGMILGLVGGVTIEPAHVIDRLETTADPALRLHGVRQAVLSRDAAAAHPWWWD